MHSALAFWEAIVYKRAARAKTPVLLPVTQVVADSLREIYGTDLDLQIIPNPVSLDRFHPGDEPELRREVGSACGWTENYFTLLFVGADFARKGLADIIRALAVVPNAACMVVGAGNAEPFKALAEELGVGKRITFLGKRRDVDQLFRVADAFVFPSLYEALPLVCLEAMASGLPLLLAPFPGYQTVLTTEANGYLATTWEELASHIAKLAGDPALVARMGANSRALAEEFGVAKVSAKLLAILECKSRGSALAPSPAIVESPEL